MPKKEARPRPTDEEILAVEGSTTIDMACRYLGMPRNMFCIAMQKQVLPVGTAVKNPGGEWSYDIRPQALVAYNKMGGIQRYNDFESHVLAMIETMTEKVAKGF